MNAFQYTCPLAAPAKYYYDKCQSFSRCQVIGSNLRNKPPSCRGSWVLRLHAARILAIEWPLYTAEPRGRPLGS